MLISSGRVLSGLMMHALGLRSLSVPPRTRQSRHFLFKSPLSDFNSSRAAALGPVGGEILICSHALLYPWALSAFNFNRTGNRFYILGSFLNQGINGLILFFCVKGVWQAAYPLQCPEAILCASALYPKCNLMVHKSRRWSRFFLLNSTSGLFLHSCFYSSEPPEGESANSHLSGNIFRSLRTASVHLY